MINIMFVLISTLKIISPIFFLGLIGFIWAKLKIEYSLDFVTRLTMNITLPCLIFSSLSKANIDEEIFNLLIYASILSYIFVTILNLIFILIIRVNISTFLHPMTFGNTGFLGLPLAYFCFGDEGLSYAIVIFTIMAIYSFTFGIWIVSGNINLKYLIKEPILISSLLGVFLFFNGIEVPHTLLKSIDLTGQIALPLMLITLGYSFGKLKIFNYYHSTLIVIYRTFIGFMIALSFAYILNLSLTAKAILIIQLSTPIAVTSFLLAERYNQNSDEVASLVVISNFLSIFYIPIILIFLI